jgi:hypothetical protein
LDNFVVCFAEISMCIQIQKEDLRRVMDMLSVRQQHARTLLIYHRWDVDCLFEVYVERGKAFMFAQAGVSVDECRDSDSSVSALVMCEICMDDVPSDEATRMDCGHCFCNTCECVYPIFSPTPPFFFFFQNFIGQKIKLQLIC